MKLKSLSLLAAIAPLFLALTPHLAWSQAAARAVPALRLAVPRALAPAAVGAAPTVVAVEATEAAVDVPEEEAAESKSKTPEELKQAQVQQERLQKIAQLNFDRRPSTILRVWNEFEQEQLKKAKEPKEKQAKKSEEPSPDAAAESSAEAEPDETSTDAPAEESVAVAAAPPLTAIAAPVAPAAATPQPTVAAPVAEPADVVASETEAKAETPDAASAEPSEVKPAKDAAAEAAAAKIALAAFEKELKDFQRDVTLGRWTEAAAFLKSQDEKVAAALYDKLVRSLASAPGQPASDMPPEVQAQLQQVAQLQNQRGARAETNVIDADDFLAIVAMSPKEFDEKQVRLISGMVRVYLGNGYLIENFVDALQRQIDAPAAARRLTSLQTGQLLVAAGQTFHAKKFLPAIDQAIADKDFAALNLLSTYYVALYQRDRKSDDLELAWKAVQEVLAAQDVEEAQQIEALKRAVDLAPDVRETLGDVWLAESFTGQPQRGVQILSTIGGLAASGLQTKAHAPELRLETLQLQTTAIEALVAASPQLAAEWSDQLTLLAQVWLREAEISYQLDTSTTRGPALQRDMYGNFFYNAQQQAAMQNNQRIKPITVAEVLKIKPSDAWLKFVREDLKPQLSKTLAQLLLKVNEEDEAFPHIERLAQSHPALADALVQEFLRVWTDNHDPNANRNRTNSYMFMYGFERRAESIPLTRSKQDRNLKELAGLVRRLNALPLDNVDEEQLAKAFTTCHSSAEVYQLDAIAEVFGPIEGLKAETLASLAQQMRTNLVGLWRAPATQNQAKTNRKQRDIEAEVFRGYQVALAAVEGGLAKHPDNWSLTLAKASLEHDLSDYRREIAPDAKFTARQEDAFAGFRRAAELYAKSIGDIRQEEETTKPYEVWYYASMGACDPERLDQKKPRDAAQLPLIREAILALPGEAAERHMAMFANTLFTRMSSVTPALKYHYAESGLAIVGDHERAAEARKVYDYYSDLVTEIKLETKIDGSDAVGQGKPFGVFVNIVHTREIERESGGFARYLQNQNNGSAYFYNYGRPLENYRDKFEEKVIAAMGDQFDVLSVTFQSEEVNSRSVARDGWRYTPYAYVLLKAKSPKADKLPPLQLDLDFLDTSGYAVIPIASSPLPLDAAATKTSPRPSANVTLTQTLDERQVDDGKLVLEVKATGQGLAPELDQLVKIAPAGFEVTDVKDEGLSVTQFDPESADNVVLSERSWLVSMKVKEGQPNAPTTFNFGEPISAGVTETIFQRYDDADLASVEKSIKLQERYAATASNRWLWYGLPLGLAAVGLIVALASRTRRPNSVATEEFAMPERITPFTVLTLLDRIEQRNGLDATGQAKLRESKNRIEQYYFQDDRQTEPNLEEIATTWVNRATPRHGRGTGQA